MWLREDYKAIENVQGKKSRIGGGRGQGPNHASIVLASGIQSSSKPDFKRHCIDIRHKAALSFQTALYYCCSFLGSLEVEFPPTPVSVIFKKGLVKFWRIPQEADQASDTVPSPFTAEASLTAELVPQRPGFEPRLRKSSTATYYLLTPSGPQSEFHPNKGQAVHTLHRGRGQYDLIHADEEGSENRIESFVVEPNVAKGEKLQWIVESGKFKVSYLLPDEDGATDSQGLLISEPVVPGFEFCDHAFLFAAGLKQIVGTAKAEQLEWLLSPLDKHQELHRRCME
ncbi:RmlC-like cupin domain-containing protein [Calycina marina]|uniref:RmlC-like cupin domain-containing protein n=1 Tax=Calycina marina TaxID=1763456 RepID=A0A9P7YZI4_9HELO|nr:RmlC-like cupin domain-containing protein [Calycina marina]